MQHACHHRRNQILILLVLLSLAWPAPPITGALAQPADIQMTTQGGMTNCDECCFRCDDGNLPEAPCSGSMLGCSGLPGVLAGGIVLPPPARVIPHGPSPADFVGWLPEPDGHPPKNAHTA